MIKYFKGISDIMDLQARWDLTEIFKDENEFLSKLNETELICQKIKLYINKVRKDPKSICDFFELEDLIYIILGKFNVYLELLELENIKNPNLEKLNSELKKVKNLIFEHIKEVKMNIASSDLDYLLKVYPKLFKYIDKINECLNIEDNIDDKWFDIYKRYEKLMNDIYDKDEEEAKYSKQIANIFNDFFKYFTEENDSLDDEAFNYGFEIRDLKKLFLKMKNNSFLNIDAENILNNLITRERKKINLLEAKNIILNSLNIFGKEYVQEVQNIFASRHIDYYPRDHKSFTEVTRFHPLFKAFASINYDEGINGTRTLAHELGHMVDNNMKENKISAYFENITIFSEFPSLLNELIVGDSVFKKANTLDEKIDILYNTLDVYFTNLIMCPININYFYNIFRESQNGNIINENKLNNILFSLNRKFNLNFTENEWTTFDFSGEIFSPAPYFFGIIGATKALNLIQNKEFNFHEYIKILKTTDDGLSNYKKLNCNPYREINFVLEEYSRIIENFKDLLYEKEKGLIKKWK